MKRRRFQPGFALLMTLALVLLAGVLLGGLALRSVSAALEADTAVERLQRRWAVATCQATLLGNAAYLLEVAERGQAMDEREEDGGTVYAGKPMRILRTRCRLAGREYELVFCDEQAKLNVNALLKRESQESVGRIIRRLSRDADAWADSTVSVKLHTRKLGKRTDVERVDALAQIFNGVSPAELAGTTVGDGLASDVTCWGGGKVNVRRASSEVLRAACDGVLSMGELDQLLGIRKSNPYQSMETIRQRLANIDSKRLDELSEVLTDVSECHGLWVIQHGPLRSWYTLVIGEGGVSKLEPETGLPGKLAVTRRYEFQW